MGQPVKVAIIGSGNIGTDLMIKIIRGAGDLQVAALVGIDPESDGLARAARMGIVAVSTGVEGLIASKGFQEIQIVFDATSANAHAYNAGKLLEAKPNIRLIDLTPAALGPYCIPVVNLDANLDEPNVNMVTCGGQATIPVVAAISSVTPVDYAEIVASISSKSAGPGTRANIDEFTETTAAAIRQVGGARASKALIILNPAEPPVLMRDTVLVLTRDGDEIAISAAIKAMVAQVADYVPGYRLKQEVQFERITIPVNVPGIGEFTGLKTSVFLEVEGAAHYLPAYAGNLDIMTSAAVHTARKIAQRSLSALEGVGA